MSDPEYYKIYKPFRNYTRKLGVIESLYVLHSYVEYIQKRKPFPEDIDVSGFSMDIDKRPHEFFLERIGVEIVINGNLFVGEKTLKKWNHFADANNKLREFENNIAKLSVDKTNILYEIYRMAHRQFSWQQYKPNQRLITRYYKIFKFPSLESIIKKVFKMDAKLYMLHCFWLFGGFCKNFMISMDKIYDVSILKKEFIEKLLDHFALELTELRGLLIKDHKVDENYGYSYHSLKAFPIIKTFYNDEKVIICPFTTLLIWRLTSGIFYELKDEDGFSDAWGDAFQNYVGEILQCFDPPFSVLPEWKYSKKKGITIDTVDWIFHDGTQALFIECKARRPTIEMKTMFDSKTAEKTLRGMIEAVSQVYKRIYDYRSGYYSIDEKKDFKLYPIIVTLEEWYIFNSEIIDEINRGVVNELLKNGIPEEYISQMPWSIVSIDDFELLIQLVNEIGISEVFNKRFSKDVFKEQVMGTFLANEFKENLRKLQPLFIQDFEEIKIDTKK